jgi:creatinine amidohydrolase
VGTDTQTCFYIAKEAAKLERAVVFPGLYFGSVPGLSMWKGSIDFSLELRLRMLDELCSEIARNGFKKIMLLNGHGGNCAMLSEFVRSTLHTKKDYMVVARNEYQFGVQRLAREIRAGQKFDELTDTDIKNVLDFSDNKYLTGHACVNETSIMLALNPDAVDLSRANAVNGLDLHKTDKLTNKPYSIDGGVGFWLIDHPDSFEGEHIEMASANIGKVILRKRIEYQAEACRLLKEDSTLFDEYMKRWG